MNLNIFPIATVPVHQPLPLNSWQGLALRTGFKPRPFASACEVSLRTLQRYFRKAHNSTVTDWLRAERMRQAQELLTTGLPIKVASIDLGFTQLSHFSREFRKTFGMSPRAFCQSRPLAHHPSLSAAPPSRATLSKASTRIGPAPRPVTKWLEC